jgi:hypothetical protein
MKHTYISLALIGVLSVSACGNKRSVTGVERKSFDGAFFKTGAKKLSKDDISYITAYAKPASQSVTGARAAVAYEGTKYCIENFGTSKINWSMDPRNEETTLPNDKDELIAQGRCLR